MGVIDGLVRKRIDAADSLGAAKQRRAVQEF
jgi:hypothetical protein